MKKVFEFLINVFQTIFGICVNTDNTNSNDKHNFVLQHSFTLQKRDFQHKYGKTSYDTGVY